MAVLIYHWGNAYVMKLRPRGFKIRLKGVSKCARRYS